MQNKPLSLHLVTLAASLLLASCQKEAVTLAPSAQILPEHLTLGNPSGATADAAQPTNYLLIRSQYALSYHCDRGILN